MQAATKPALRTYTVFEALDRTFRIYRENFLACIGLSAAVIIPLTLINQVVADAYSNQIINALNRSPGASTSFVLQQQLASLGWILLIVGAITTLIQSVFVSGTLTIIASESQFGRRITIGEALSLANRKFANLFSGLVLYYLLLIALVLGLAVILFACGLGIVLLVYVSVAANAFIIPVIALEDIRAVDGVRRAYDLGRARFWQVFGLIFLIGLIGVVIGLALGGSQALLTGMTVTTVQTDETVSFILQTVIQVFLAPVLPIGMTVLYYDTRVRLERFDLALIATDKPDARAEDVPSPAPQGSILNNQDFANMGILLVILIVIFVIVYLLFVALFSAALRGAGF